MDKLIIFNCIFLIIIFFGLYCCKKFINKDKHENLILLFAALLTILCHYSSIAYHFFTSGSATNFLRANPNLLLPIYPCNVVMWGCLIYGLIKNKESKFALLLADYLFWFGIFSTLVGMFANIDFINNPTFKNFDVTKGIIAHATLLFNVLLIFVFGHIKIDLLKNMTHIVISVIIMYMIGLYCNKVFEILGSAEMAYNVNSMFIIHSPFPTIPFLTYPVIASLSLILYFGLFSLCELFVYKKGNRWISRLKRLKENQ